MMRIGREREREREREAVSPSSPVKWGGHEITTKGIDLSAPIYEELGNPNTIIDGSPVQGSDILKVPIADLGLARVKHIPDGGIVPLLSGMM